jgi:hypothetical protein
LNLEDVSLTLRVGPLSCWCPVRGEAATESLGDTGTTDGGSSDEDERDALSVLVPAIINGGPTGSSSEKLSFKQAVLSNREGGQGEAGVWQRGWGGRGRTVPVPVLGEDHLDWRISHFCILRGGPR